MGWLIAAIILLLLAWLPLGINLRYNAEGIRICIIAGPIRYTLLPGKPKQKQKKEKPKKEKIAPKSDVKKEADSQKPSQPEEKGGSLLDFLPLVKVGLDLLDGFRRKLRVDVLEVKLIMAGNDPANLAVNYGRTWAAVANLDPILQRIFVIKKKNIDIECDFLAQTTTIIARMDLTITLGRILGLGIKYGWRALVEFLKIRKKRKDGTINESKSS